MVLRRWRLLLWSLGADGVDAEADDGKKEQSIPQKKKIVDTIQKNEKYTAIHKKKILRKTKILLWATQDDIRFCWIATNIQDDTEKNKNKNYCLTFQNW